MACVLLIEDAPTIVKLIETTIAPLGHMVIARGDGESGLEAIDQIALDLVVLDIGLPGLDGWEVLDRVRHTYSPEDLPVVVVTAHGDAGDRLRAMELGANRFLPKPFHPESLREAVQSLLGSAA